MFYAESVKHWKNATDAFFVYSERTPLRAHNFKINDTINIYLFKVNNRNTRKGSEICSKLTLKTPELRH